MHATAMVVINNSYSMGLNKLNGKLADKTHDLLVGLMPTLRFLLGFPQVFKHFILGYGFPNSSQYLIPSHSLNLLFSTILRNNIFGFVFHLTVPSSKRL